MRMVICVAALAGMNQPMRARGGDEPVSRVYENRLKPILHARADPGRLSRFC